MFVQLQLDSISNIHLNLTTRLRCISISAMSIALRHPHDFGTALPHTTTGHHE